MVIGNSLSTMHRLRPALERAIAEAGDVTDYAGVCDDVIWNRLQVFESGESILLVEVQQYRRAKVLQLCYGAGALDEMEPWLDAILEWGRSQGCTKVVMLGRRGWERSFLGKRLKPTHTLLEGEL